MKEGLKKFLGVMTVYSILGGSAGIGASAFYSSNLAGVAGFDICSFNDALVTSVPGMTDEEVKAMNLCADFLLLVVEITHADYYEELEKYTHKLKVLQREVNKRGMGRIRSACGLWARNYGKHENWERIERMFREARDSLSAYKANALDRWIDKTTEQLPYYFK